MQRYREHTNTRCTRDVAISAPRMFVSAGKSTRHLRIFLCGVCSHQRTRIMFLGLSLSLLCLVTTILFIGLTCSVTTIIMVVTMCTVGKCILSQFCPFYSLFGIDSVSVHRYTIDDLQNCQIGDLGGRFRYGGFRFWLQALNLAEEGHGGPWGAARAAQQMNRP